VTDSEQRWRAVKAHIAKGDKARDKAEQHYIAAGQHLSSLKAEHTGTWAEWEALVKERAGIGKSRASELMQIADGRKTVESVRAEKAESVRQLRKRESSPLRSGEEGVLKCCGLRAWVLPCGHAKNEDGEFLCDYADVDNRGNPIWVRSCCGQETPRDPGIRCSECGDKPSTILTLWKIRGAAAS
jgi:hypothetical protein